MDSKAHHRWIFCCPKGFSMAASPVEEAEDVLKPRKPGGWKTMPYILGNETFERLATFGLLANFMVYLRARYNMDQVSATNLINIWAGITNFAPLLGAFFSDACFGRFHVIAFGSLASFLGMLILTLTAWIPTLHPQPCRAQEEAQVCSRPTSAQLGFLFLGLCFLSIGTGGVRPCSIPFGVDQFDCTSDKGRRSINSYYNWYYTTFTLALIFALTIVVYIQSNISWVLGFGIPTILMLGSIILFFLGTKSYIYIEPEGSIFSSVAQVFVASYKKRRLNLPCDDGKEAVTFYDPPVKGVLAAKLTLTDEYRFLNKSAIIDEGELSTDGTPTDKWRLCSTQQIEEVKCLLRVLPIWASGIICFTAVAQQVTFVVSQAMSMDRHITPSFQIPPGSLVIISLLTIGIWVPIYDRYIVPCVRKNITKHEEGITLLQRMGIGLVFSVLSMIVAGVIEQKRRDSANTRTTNNYYHGIGRQAGSGAAAISVFWLAPQLILLGFAESFNFIAQIEFYNKQFPENMRSIATSLFFCTVAMASYFSSLVVSLVHGLTGRRGKPDWLTDDINQGRVDWYYYLIAGLGSINFVYFVVCATKFRYKKIEIRGTEGKHERP